MSSVLQRHTHKCIQCITLYFLLYASCYAGAATAHCFSDDEDPLPQLPTCLDGELRVVPSYDSGDGCLQAASSENATAMLEMAWRHERGRDVRIDNDEAMKWLVQAARLGNENAQLCLANRLTSDAFGSVDQEASIELCRALAVNGNPKGEYELGRCYVLGLGVERDNTMGADWIAKAARQNLVLAQYATGLLFERGIGVPTDYVESATWYKKACEKKRPEAQLRLGHLYRTGRGVEQDEDEGMRWILKAASQGLIEAQWDAAQIILETSESEKEERKAIRWLEKLAKNNHYEGLLQLAITAPKNFTKLSRKLNYSRRSGEPTNAQGSAVNISGWIEEFDDKQLSLMLKSRKRLTIDTIGIQDQDVLAKRGRYATIYGILAGDTVEATLCSVPAPSYIIDSKIPRIPAIVGGRYTNYPVDVWITNTGNQPIESITIHVNLFQNKLNNRTLNETVGPLNPGKTRSFRKTFLYYNYQRIESTRFPTQNVSVSNMIY